MTLAEIRAAVRAMVHEDSQEAGALLKADNILLDYAINAAADAVVLDLVPVVPHFFVTYEDISLVSGTSSYTLTKEWMQIVAVKKNVSGQAPAIIPYYENEDEFYAQNTGETGSEPKGWTLNGASIMFMPKPSAAYASWARVWIVKPEASTMATTGPTMIPRMAHRLIPLMATIILAKIVESKNDSKWEALYKYTLTKVERVLGPAVQQQSRFVRPPMGEVVSVDARDKVLYDRVGFFD